MDISSRWNESQGRLALVDELLVDVAVKIQLSPTLRDKAVEHYSAINRHIGRSRSPLAGRVLQFYPQGSMAIGATIRSRDDDDLFDIDLIAEVDLPGEAPAGILDTLFEAMNGDFGSAYHGKVRRQTRCVTVDYEDMHLDVTPLCRIAGWPERGGLVTDARAAMAGPVPAEPHPHDVELLERVYRQLPVRLRQFLHQHSFGTPFLLANVRDGTLTCRSRMPRAKSTL